MNFTPFPTMTTERLILRQVNASDIQDMFLLRSDERVMKFLDRPTAKTLDDARQVIENIHKRILNNAGITWAITRKHDDTLIGTIGYWPILKEHFRAEIGYLLHPDFHGKGIMQEAFTQILDYGFSTLQLHSIEANVNPKNVSSIKLLERNAFVREAYFTENYYYNGMFLDTAIYSLLNHTDRANRKAEKGKHLKT